MASVKFLIRGTKNPSPLYVRFVHAKEIDIVYRLNILINPKNFDKKRELIKNVIDVKNRDEINIKLSELKLGIVSSFNSSYIQGELINRDWMENLIKDFFQRPEENGFKVKREKMYFYDFICWWLTEKAPTYKISSDKLLSKDNIYKYEYLANIINEFQKELKIDPKLSELDNIYFDKFSSYLTDQNYATSTKKRLINRLKFFCRRAEELNLQVNSEYKMKVFVDKKEEVDFKDPYLSVEEIQMISELEVNDEKLNNIKDNFIIGLWTGLRITDFLQRLSIEDIDNSYIRTQTQKTKTDVAIPLHPMVKSILKRRNGLPEKVSNIEFNKGIKLICEKAGIDTLITGGIAHTTLDLESGKKVTRKEIREFKKFELVSSHICRRLFATNHFGKVPNKVIMDVCGWASEKQMLEYNKQTNIDSAKILAEYWKREMSKLEEIS